MQRSKLPQGGRLALVVKPAALCAHVHVHMHVHVCFPPVGLQGVVAWLCVPARPSRAMMALCPSSVIAYKGVSVPTYEGQHMRVAGGCRCCTSSTHAGHEQTRALNAVHTGFFDRCVPGQPEGLKGYSC